MCASIFALIPFVNPVLRGLLVVRLGERAPLLSVLAMGSVRLCSQVVQLR
eukprot:m.158872 g.158872  ORF g.158872 m.158872 type:complete len:50 (+) comp14338_c1_seq2:1982-2131(+)